MQKTSTRVEDVHTSRGVQEFDKMKYKVLWKNNIQESLTEKHPATTFIYAYASDFYSSNIFNESHFPESTVGQISEVSLALTHLKTL